jgi:hypothetical protein
MPKDEARPMRLWRENRINQEWSISDEDLIERFQKWPRRARTIVWRGIEYALRLFITDREDRGGLNSVFDEEPFQQFLTRHWQRLIEANAHVEAEIELLGEGSK